MVAAQAAASATPKLPNRSGASGGGPGLASSVPTIAVKVMSATTFGFVSSRYRRHRGGALVATSDVLATCSLACRSGVGSLACARGSHQRERCEQQQRRAGRVGGREQQRKALKHHRDADEKLQPERAEHRPGAQPRVPEAALAQRVDRGERKRRGGDDGAQAMGEMDGDARGGG